MNRTRQTHKIASVALAVLMAITLGPWSQLTPAQADSTSAVTPAVETGETTVNDTSAKAADGNSTSSDEAAASIDTNSQQNADQSSATTDESTAVATDAVTAIDQGESSVAVTSQSDNAKTAITPQAGTLTDVFLKSSGSSSGAGTSPSTAVKTFDEAKALLAPGGTIWICGEVKVTDSQTWDLDGYGTGGTGAGSVKRWVSGNAGGLTDATYAGRLFTITKSGNLTVMNCDVDGMKGTAGKTDSMFYASGSSASLTLTTGAVAENGFATQGGAIYLTSAAMGTVGGDAVIKNCQSSDASSVADVGSGSNLTIGGSASITGNTGNYAPIFLRDSGNTLTIQGNADISGNTGDAAGVAMTHSSNTIYITGGTISNNSGGYSGAFLLDKLGNILYMTGGTISGNANTRSSGGAILLVGTNKAFITGGTITKNSAANYGAGICAETRDTVGVGGTACIIGNTDAATKGNIWLPDNGTLKVVSAFSSGASVGVYTQGTAYGAGQDFAYGSTAYKITASDAAYLSDDMGNYGTIADLGNNAIKWSGSLNNVFLRSDGNDASNGTTPDTAVATFAKAKTLLKPGGTIWICGAVNAAGAETWDLGGYGANSTGPGTIKRWVNGQVSGITTGTYTGNLVVANGTANSVTMKNLTLDGMNAGASSKRSASAGSNLWASNSGTITLGTGCVVENGTSYHGGGASLTDGGKLMMTDDSVLKNCSAGDAGGAVDMAGKSSLTMSGTSSITGCTSPFGIIFLRQANGTDNVVSLSGSASIKGNTTARSDQGTIDGHGTNTINIAETASITGNTAGKGGGINLERYDTLNMTGGSITGNTASVLGAGVNVNVSNATVNLSGAASIKDNTDSTSKGNLAIPAGYKVNVAGLLTGGASSIGVRVVAVDHKSLHEFAKGSGYTTMAADASAFFDDYTTLPVELTPGTTVTPADGTDNTIRFAGYKVAYDTYGNEPSAEDPPVPDAIATKTGLSYSSVNLLPTTTLTRNGYIFSGWYTKADESGTQVASTAKYSDIQPDRTVTTTTLYAHWTEKQQYSVVYDSNGGSAVAGLTNLKWTATGLIPTGANIPTRPGYTLTGWKYDPAGDNVNVIGSTSYRSLAKVDTKTTITLVAQWTESPAVDIAYVSNDTTAGTVTLASESVRPATGYPAGSAAIAKTGYTFDGWYDANGNLLSTEAYFIPSRNDDGIYEAATYTARFSPAIDTNYVVEYYQQDITGTGYTEVTADAVEGQGATATAPSVTQNAYAGFTYTRTTYETSTTAEGATAQIIAGDGSLVVRLYYTRNVHDVTFDIQGHGVTPTGYVGVRLGATIAEPTAPSETGYTFGGWYTDAACTMAWDFTTNTMPDENLTLYAKWTINTYKARFQAGQGGILGGTVSAQDVAYSGNAKGVCTQSPISGDYDFLGWEYSYTGADGQPYSGVVDDYTTVPIYGDVMFTATYAKKPFVSITATNGYDNIVLGTTPSTDTPTAVTSKIDSSITPLTLPTSMAMKYAPINANYSSTPESITVTDLAGNTATLKDGANTFTPAGATSAVTITVSHTSQTIIATNVNDSLKFEVVFSAVQASYKVEHFEQNANGSYPATATDTDTYSDVEAGTAADYTPKTYAGASYDATKTTWEATSATASSTVLAVQPDDSLVIKLYYPLNTYTVTYDANGHGTAPSPQYNVRYGSTLIEPTAPHQDGWAFGGWYTDSACSAGSEWAFGEGGSAVTGDTTLYAKWTAKTYTVVYDTQGGTTIEPDHGVTWSQASLTATTTRPGYTFGGWNTKADGTGDTVDAATTYSTLAGDDDTQATETIYAIWVERSNFTLHYDSDGGTDVEDRTGVSWTQDKLVPTSPTRTGYTLNGWYTAAGAEIDDTTQFSATDPSGASDATVTAKWDANAYSIAFDKNGTDATGTMANEAMTYDVAADLTTNAYSRPGYDFTGWKDDSGASYTDGQEVENLTATADATVTLHA